MFQSYSGEELLFILLPLDDGIEMSRALTIVKLAIRCYISGLIGAYLGGV